jgi:hypothetical protein
VLDASPASGSEPADLLATQKMFANIPPPSGAAGLVREWLGGIECFFELSRRKLRLLSYVGWVLNCVASNSTLLVIKKLVCVQV